MRIAVVAALALFILILVVAWVGSERAHPQMIDQDPAAVDAQRFHHK